MAVAAGRHWPRSGRPGRPIAVPCHPRRDERPGVTDCAVALTVGDAGRSRPSSKGGRAPRPRRVRVQDRETGATWDATGRAVAGLLRGRLVAPPAYLDTDWYARSPSTRHCPPAAASSRARRVCNHELAWPVRPGEKSTSPIDHIHRVDDFPQRPCPTLTWPGAWCPGRADIEDPTMRPTCAWQTRPAGRPPQRGEPRRRVAPTPTRRLPGAAHRVPGVGGPAS
jgi:hypothetical protein